MPYRINYLDALGIHRLTAVTESLTDGNTLIGEMTAAAPSAARRLAAVDDPLHGLQLRVIQPPQTLDTTGGLPVLYLGGTIDPHNNWQATAIAALHAQPTNIINPRRERPTLPGQETETAARWRRLRLFLADIAVYWFAAGDPDPMAALELGTQFGASLQLVVGAAPDCTARPALTAHIRYQEPDAVLHDTLAATIAAAIAHIDGHDPHRLTAARVTLDPEAVAVFLRETILARDQDRDLAEQLDEIVDEAGRAAAVGIDPTLLIRIYAAVDRLRRDGDDPLGWTELHHAAANLLQL